MLRRSYYTDEQWETFRQACEGKETPFLIVLLDVIKQNYIDLQRCFPKAKIHYAIKANPERQVLSLLRDLGSSFDVASIYELDRVLDLGVEPERISYGNTIKKAKHIRYAYERGIRLFVTDSEADLRNIAKAAPGSRVFVRVLTEGVETADWPLSRKFGCHTDLAVDLLELAKALHLEPYGVSFHVGSQQRDVGAWDAALAKVKYVFDYLLEEGIKIKMINLGGGFPANYLGKVHPLEVYAKEITRYLEEDYGDDIPELILEPGRSLVGNAGILVSEIVLISRKSRISLNRWIYTDVGKFCGLMETLEESIHYPIYTEKSGELEAAIIAGPTCDSMDIMYENTQYDLPLSLSIGDRLYWFSTGAYTSTYSAVEFNGFPPLKTFCI